MMVVCDIANGQWTKIYQTDSCDCILQSGFPLAGMGFFGNDSGVVCSEGIGAVTAVTLDGGLSWDTIPIDPRVTENIYPPPYELGSTSCFLDVNHIWFCNGAAVCHTSDAGKTWVVDSNRDSLAYGNCIYFVDSLIGFEGGEGLLMYRTSDGGKSWSIVHSQSGGNGYNVYQIKFCNPKLGLAICGDLVGLILRTTDSGMTWALTTDINHFGYGQADCLSYPDPHNAWYTDGAFLRHSTDSGLTWAIVGAEYPIGGQLNSISFIDSLHGIATAHSGTSFIFGYTSDGGNSWQKSTIDSERYVGLTSFTDTNTAYAGAFDAVFKLDVGDLGVQHTPIFDNNLQIYPNPFSQSTQITFTSQAAGYAEVSVVNMLGVEVAQLFSGELGAGEHNFSWSNPTVLPDGVYECLVRMNGQVDDRSSTVQTLPVVLLR